MSGLKGTLLLAAVLLLAGCSGSTTSESDQHKDKIEFSQNELTIFENEDAAIPISWSKFDRGIYVKSDYDLASNPLSIKVASSDETVATVTSDGKVHGVSAGTTTLKVSGGTDVTAKGTLSVTVKAGGLTVFSQDLTQPLTVDMLYLRVGLDAVTMQGMDVDRHGTCYQTWEDTSAGAMMLRAFNNDGSQIGDDMTLPSGGHGDSFCIEYDSEDGNLYFWTNGTMGEHSTNGGYSGGKANDTDVRLICRHKYVSGATQYAEDAVERWYINDNGCRMIDVDTEHDVMACWTYQSGDYIYVYRLSDIRKASKVTKTVTRTSHDNGMSVECYDLRTVDPIGAFPWTRLGVATGTTNSGAVQGFCVYDDRIYVTSGAGTDPATLISVLDFKGNLVQQLVPLGVSSDKNKLIALGLTTSGSFEPEGVHIHQGEMYLGFCGYCATSANKRHCCIIKLK